MSVGIIIGIILLVITIICFVLDYLSDFCESGNIITFLFLLITLLFGISGTVETIKEINMAKPGYIINIDNERNIEVVQRKKNYIQFIKDKDTLVVSKSVWINEILNNAKVVNIKNF